MIETIYNKNLALTALIGIIASLLLSFRKGYFSPIPVYGAIIFIVIMFFGYFLSNLLLQDQDSALLILACFIAQLGLIMLYRIKPESAVKQITWFGIGVFLFFISSLLSKSWVEIKLGLFTFSLLQLYY